MSEVIIVGAGPTGLLLAGDLAAAGISCTILERRAQETNLSRAFAVHARTLELLDARGLADELIATGQKVPMLRFLGQLQIDLSGLPSRFPYLLVTPQYQTEHFLTRRAEEHGVEIVTDAEVVGVRQDAGGVTVDVRHADGTTETRRAPYLVGTDGVRSAVREALGEPFPGRSAVQSVMLADVRLAQAPPDVLTVNASGGAFGFLAPFGDGWYRVIAWDRHNQQPDTAPVDFAELRDVIGRTLGTDYGMHDPRWMSRFHSDERQVPQYRVDRILLAGDAAHVHSPAGGQGMNTGMQDAANLSWKLAATIRGRGPAGLLDTYQTERHAVGEEVIKLSASLLRLGMLRSWQLPVARTIASIAVRQPAITRTLAGRVSGVGVRYEAPRDAHPLTGTRAPDFDGRGVDGDDGRLYETLRSGEFVLVTSAAAGAEADRLDGVRTLVRSTNEPTMLVRPDGYVAWAADRPTDQEIRSAVETWTGQTR